MPLRKRSDSADERATEDFNLIRHTVELELALEFGDANASPIMIPGMDSDRVFSSQSLTQRTENALCFSPAL